MAGQKDIGKIIIRRSIVKWSIPSAINLPKDDYYILYSREFTFAGSTWELRLHANGMKFNNTFGWLGVSLVNEGSMKKYTPFSVRIGVIGKCGDELLSVTADRSDDSMWYTANKLIMREEFDSRRGQMTPDDVLTIFCEILVSKATQTEGNIYAKTPEKRKSRSIESVEIATQTEELARKESETTREEDTADIETSTTISAEVGKSKLAQEMKKLLLTRRDSDITLKLKDKEFRVHKNILTARSPIFLSMLQHNMSDNSRETLTVEGSDPQTFREFLHYIYTGRIEDLSLKNVLSIYTIACTYQVHELKQECMKFMKENMPIEFFQDIKSVTLRRREV